MSPQFDWLYSDIGRPSVPPEQLLRALVLQALYTVRSERLLMVTENLRGQSAETEIGGAMPRRPSTRFGCAHCSRNQPAETNEWAPRTMTDDVIIERIVTPEPNITACRMIRKAKTETNLLATTSGSRILLRMFEDLSKSSVPPKLRKQNIADRPHIWTIWLAAAASIISLGSVVVSIQSFRTSRDSLKLNLAQSPASLQVSAAKYRIDRDDSKVVLELTLTNSGKVAANNIAVEYYISYLSSSGTESFDIVLSTASRLDDIIEIPAAFSRPVYIKSTESLHLNPGRLPKEVQFSGNTIYTDSLSGKLAKDTWCFAFRPTRTALYPPELARCQYEMRTYELPQTLSVPHFYVPEPKR